MPAVVTTTDAPEAVKAALGDKATVRVHDDAGNDVTVQQTPEEKAAAEKAAAEKAAAGNVEEKDGNSAAPDEGKNSSESATEGGEAKPAKETEAEKRIKKLTKDNADLKRQLEAKPPAESAKQPTAPAAETKVEAEPKAEDYETHGEYLKALSKWAAKEARKEQRVEDAKAAEAQRQKDVIAAWNTQVEEGKKKYPDWDDVMSDQIVVGKIAARALMESPDGGELSYFIGKNPDEAKKLVALKTEREVYMAIGELRAKVTGAAKPNKDAKKDEKPNSQQPAKKPAPITPVRGGGGGNTEKAPKDMTYKEFKAHRERQIAARQQH